MDGQRYGMATREIKSGYVCMNWVYDTLAEAEAKRDQFLKDTRGQFVAVIVTI